MSYKIAILGGGVGGLSAAHELIERGFAVSVFERNHVFGGKARSLYVPNSGTGGRRDLPGEHGFRFFPAFYKHLPDTLKRIPFPGNVSVFNNLVHATRIEVAQAGKPPLILTARLPQTMEDWLLAFKELFEGIGVPDDEVLFFADRLLTLLTSCPERRVSEYEQISWWTFVAAASHSAIYQTLLAEGLTRSLVAVRAQEGSTRTVGYILLQLIFGILTWGGFDRLLSGPTSEVWLLPWVQYLSQKGVQFQPDTTIKAFNSDASGLTSVTVEQGGQQAEISADFYISALPVEIMTGLVTSEMKTLAPSLAHLDSLRTAWMNGIQFFLKQDVPLDFGHTLYADSPWALTSVSQRQFWQQANLADYGDGQVGGLLSADISDWETPGILYGKPAMQCTAQEIKDEVWAQMKAHLNVAGAEPIRDDNLLTWFLDPDVQFPNPSAVTNLEPLLINTANSLQYRPNAATEIPNLFLASDYVRTYTDLACMEAANEAARRAVNAILTKTGSTQPPASLWEMQEPDCFKPLIEYDRLRFRMGLSHTSIGPI
ncbi:FAD-dependent oxidoreductase [Edaphobacter paludis]|uniref:FAD-dependent oxidoreductase n=1 Tax=Edaphobacter paludis TaxID=3035702 RepID=A0AAU7CX69_9BACT